MILCLIETSPSIAPSNLNQVGLPVINRKTDLVKKRVMLSKNLIINFNQLLPYKGLMRNLTA